MNGLIRAIPTYYEGTQFRSRLEARWAAFFDLAGWPWEYEPVDLNGWIPDFRLRGKTPALCEIKPIDIASILDPVGGIYQVRIGTILKSIVPNVLNVREQFGRQSSVVNGPMPFPLDHEIIVLGLCPWVDSVCGGSCLGVMLRECSDWCQGEGEDIAELFGGTKTALDYAAVLGSYEYRIGGEHDGDHHLIDIDGDFTNKLWRAAGNIVQWNR